MLQILLAFSMVHCTHGSSQPASGQCNGVYLSALYVLLHLCPLALRYRLNVDK